MPATLPSTPLLRDIAEDIAEQIAQVDLAGQIGIALKLLLIVTRRLPPHLQAETSAEVLLALAQDLPR